MFGKHGHHAVDKIDRGGAFLSLLVEGALGTHVMRHIGNVHSGLPVSVGQSAQRKRVVKVLCVTRVDGECGHIAHVDSAGNLGRGYAGIDFLGGTLHLLGIVVRESEFGQYGMHLGIVLAVAAKDVNHLAVRILCIVGPVGYAHDGLVAGLAAFQLSARNEDVGCQEL